MRNKQKKLEKAFLAFQELYKEYDKEKSFIIGESLVFAEDNCGGLILYIPHTKDKDYIKRSVEVALVEVNNNWQKEKLLPQPNKG